MKFYAFLTVFVVGISPGICLMWIFLMTTVNWHDALDVTTLAAVVFLIQGMRREDRAAERAMRRVRRWERHERSGIRPEWVSRVDNFDSLEDSEISSKEGIRK